MKTIDLDFGVPNPIQQRVIDSFRNGKRIVLLVSGRQAGKSHFGARWVISQIMNPNAPNKLGAVIAPTYNDGRVAIRKIKEVLQQDPRLWKKVKYRERPLPSFQFPDGWMVEIHSAYDPDSLRGPTFDFVWYDEVAKGSKESFDVVMPTLLASNGMFLGTTTPRGKQNWIFESLYLKACEPGDKDYDPTKFNPKYGVVSGTTKENEANLSTDAIETLQDQYGEGSLFALQELEGEFVSFRGLVYQWDELKNYLNPDKMPDPRECSVVVGGLDFGWTDPTSAHVYGYKDGAWWVFDEIYESQLETNDLAVELMRMHRKYGVSVWIADSARPDEIVALRSRGIPVRAIDKPQVVTRVREMAVFTDHNRFKVSHRCGNLRNELQMYQWPSEDKMNKPGEAKPIDKFNHAMDEAGYVIWSFRHLWRNDPKYKWENEEEDDDSTNDEEAEDLILRYKGGKSYRGHRVARRTGRAGLYSR